MKKFLFIILLAALTACSSNSLVNTPTLTPTVTPAPTSTKIPEMTSPFGTDGFIGEGKIGPWVGEANRVEPGQALLDNVKKLSKDGETVVFEVQDAEGNKGQMVFVLEKDADGKIVKRFVGWNKDNMGVKRLVENGIINDLDELVALPDGGFGVMGLDGNLTPVIFEGALVDNFIQLIPSVKNDEKRARINRDANIALGVEPAISVELKAEAVALFEKMSVDPSKYELKMDGEVVVGIDKASGNEVFRDGKFELRYAVEAAVNSGDLMPTKYKPRDEGDVGFINIPTEKTYDLYLFPLIDRVMAGFPKNTFIAGKASFNGLMLDFDKLAYGVVIKVDKKNPNTLQYLGYETSAGKIIVVPLKSGSFEKVMDFWGN